MIPSESSYRVRSYIRTFAPIPHVHLHIYLHMGRSRSRWLDRALYILIASTQEPPVTEPTPSLEQLYAPLRREAIWAWAK